MTICFNMAFYHAGSDLSEQWSHFFLIFTFTLFYVSIMFFWVISLNISKIKTQWITFLARNAFDHWLRKKWKDEFGGDLYFFHGSSNSCGVLIVFYGNQDITVKKVVWQKRTSTCFRCTNWRLWFFAMKYL